MSKPNQLIDAVKTAIAIHNGDYSSLRDKSFVISDNIKKDHHPGGKTVKKSRIDKLEGRMDQFEGRMGRFEEKIDRIEESITNLARIVEDGFKRVNTRIDNLEKDVNARIDRIDDRLDYIVKANNLKDR
ncbi:MAG: hypothetical protein MJ213_00375 [Bacilli bacterium]|nr:hypothetical protein [Bacilli bacterium]